MRLRRLAYAMVFAAAGLSGCGGGGEDGGERYRLVTLDPGHFHAALVQKTMYPVVDPVVHVYAPDGPDVDMHLARIEGFNDRAESPTSWETVVYRGDDYFERMLADGAGDIVVISGNNARKTDYILKSLEAGLNVYADKPMATTREQFLRLEEAVALAGEKDLMLLDIMTERYEITTILQKELSLIPAIYGSQLAGTPAEPGITKESVHHFFKFVAGQPLQRPPWFFDAAQEGDGLVDVTTHLVDLVQWECFPGEVIDYREDVVVDAARRWPTPLTLDEFTAVTRLGELPPYLAGNFENGRLQVWANGEIGYRIRGIHARVRVSWEYRAPEGGGDTHYSAMRGSASTLVIRQGPEQGYVPQLYVEPVAGSGLDDSRLADALAPLAERYPGISTRPSANGWQVVIPDEYRVGHEAHFAQVTEAYLDYLANGSIPDWEWPNILAKYYVTTTALEIAGAP